MKIRKPFVGMIAFIIVLLTMPLGHTVMILMEELLGHEYVFFAAGLLGFLGLALLFWGVIQKNETHATLLGLFAALFIWTGWIEFAFVYYANRFGVQPLMMDGEVVTKPEYLIMPSSVGFWAILMIYYFLGSKSGCHFFNWFQKKLKIAKPIQLKQSSGNTAVTTFMELIVLLWTFYLVLLFVYDENFFGDQHIVTYVVAFGSLLWSAYLFIKLLKIPNMAYAVRYSIPTVIIFWNFVEVMGRWEFFDEFWVEPMEYWLEMTIIAIIIGILAVVIYNDRKKSRSLKPG